MKNSYKAYVVREIEKGVFKGEIEELATVDLPEGEVLVKVEYSSLNYKDALSANGNRGVTRRYPHVPGIDAAGVVVQSESRQFIKGDRVVASCFDLGMNHPGGFAEYIRVPAGWIVKLSDQLSTRESMIYGTGGFTAGRCVSFLLDQGVSPEKGPVLVTGATGGVGSMAVAILAKIGFEVVAVSGKKENKFLESLGASQVLERDAFSKSSSRLLLKEKWAGVVDTVGGPCLEAAIKQTKYDGIVTACGNAGGAELNLTVYPFILRGVRLVGVDSAQCGGEPRQKVWDKLAGDWKLNMLEEMAQVISLDELDEAISAMLAGKSKGRKVVALQ